MLRNACSPLAIVTKTAKQHIHASYPVQARLVSGDAATNRPSRFASSNAPPKRPSPSTRPPRPRRDASDGRQKFKPRSDALPKLLTPYKTSQRLLKLCDERKIDEAVKYLQELPLDAQNVAVWNTMLQQACLAKRYQMAYTLYIEMKRRGFKPTSRTYATLLGGLTSITNWHQRRKLLGNVHTLHRNYLDYMAAVKAHDPQSSELTPAPSAAYIRILGAANLWQEVFDVYNEMDKDGPLAPNVYVYTALFRCLENRAHAATGEDAEATREQAGSEARLIWRTIIREIEKGKDMVVDEKLVAAVISTLALGRPADQLLAFDIIRDYVGLAKPGETAPPASVALSPLLLSDILWVCNVTNKHRLTVQYMTDLMESKPELIDRGHIDHVLEAYGSLAAMGATTEAARALQALEWLHDRAAAAQYRTTLLPGQATYTLVLLACWRARDWDTALRTLEIMTGYDPADFADGSGVARPQMATRSVRRYMPPNTAGMSFLLRIALATGNPAVMRQCLRIVQQLGLSQFLTVPEPPEPPKERLRTASRFKEDAGYYVYKVASTLSSIVDALVPKKTEDSAPLTKDERIWVALRKQAKDCIFDRRRPQVTSESTPDLELEPLGGSRALSQTDRAVEWESISRSQNGSKTRW